MCRLPPLKGIHLSRMRRPPCTTSRSSQPARPGRRCTRGALAPSWCAPSGRSRQSAGRSAAWFAAPAVRPGRRRRSQSARADSGGRGDVHDRSCQKLASCRRCRWRRLAQCLGIAHAIQMQQQAAYGLASGGSSPAVLPGRRSPRRHGFFHVLGKGAGAGLPAGTGSWCCFEHGAQRKKHRLPTPDGACPGRQLAVGLERARSARRCAGRASPSSAMSSAVRAKA